MKELYLLQSGFITDIESGLFKYVADVPTFRDKILNKDNTGDIPEYFYNEQVTRLWLRYESNNGFISEFSFREELISTAFSAFGHKNFLDWVKLQKNSPYFSDLHKSFLFETLSFITGTPRKLSISQWYPLIDATEVKRSVHFDYTQYFGTEESIGLLPSFTSHVILDWLRQKDGYTDLMYALWLFFGKRDRQSTITATHKRSDNLIQIGANAVSGV